MKIYSGESRGGLPSLFWAKKEEMTEGRKAGTPPPLSSRSGSATDLYFAKGKSTRTFLKFL